MRYATRVKPISYLKANAAEGLAELADRGAHPPELLALGIRDFRQTGFKPYRVIFRVGGDQVVIHLIVDGRRDLTSLLGRRLLGA